LDVSSYPVVVVVVSLVAQSGRSIIDASSQLIHTIRVLSSQLYGVALTPRVTEGRQAGGSVGTMRRNVGDASTERAGEARRRRGTGSTSDARRLNCGSHAANKQGGPGVWERTHGSFWDGDHDGFVVVGGGELDCKSFLPFFDCIRPAYDNARGLTLSALTQ
jgi:hypothetical protein